MRHILGVILSVVAVCLLGGLVAMGVYRCIGLFQPDGEVVRDQFSYMHGFAHGAEWAAPNRFHEGLYLAADSSWNQFDAGKSTTGLLIAPEEK